MKKFLILLGLLGSSLAFGQENLSEADREILISMRNRMQMQQSQWFDDGDFPHAIRSLEFQVKVLPFDYEAVTNLSYMYKNVEDYGNELAILVWFKETFPNMPDSAYPLAEFYYLKRSYRMVVSLLSPVVEKFPNQHPNTYRILAHSYDRTGMFKQALATWDAYIKLAPNDEAAKVNRDKVQQKLKK